MPAKLAMLGSFLKVDKWTQVEDFHVFPDEMTKERAVGKLRTVFSSRNILKKKLSEELRKIVLEEDFHVLPDVPRDSFADKPGEKLDSLKMQLEK